MFLWQPEGMPNDQKYGPAWTPFETAEEAEARFVAKFKEALEAKAQKDALDRKFAALAQLPPVPGPGQEYFTVATNAPGFTPKDATLAEPGGRKDDSGKDRMGLLPYRALRLVAKVMTFGAKKYGANNWQKVEAWRYEDALLRHFEEYKSGKWLDDGPEGTGLPHLACMACSVLFLLAIKGNLFDKDAAP